MSLINEKDLLKILNIKEKKGKWLATFVKQFLGIEKLNQIFNEKSSLSGLEFIDSVFDNLHIKYSIADISIKNIPETGPFIIIANHPLGGLDGLLLIKIICEIRPDFKLQGNFLLHQIEPIRDYIFPVNTTENLKGINTSSGGIKTSYEHLRRGGSLGIFPAGEVSSYQFKDIKISDRQWQKSTIQFIQKAEVPVIPVCFYGYNSALFYLLSQIHPVFRTAKLPSEFFNKSNQTIKIEIRKPISSKNIRSFPTLESLSQYLRAKTYSLNKSVEIETFFKFRQYKKEQLIQPVIEPIDTELIKSDLLKLESEYLLFTQGSFSIYCAPFNNIPHIISELGRLREITFREVGEGTNKSIDIDPYDIYYNHLIIWDNSNNKIVGAYRIGKGKDILKQYGKNGFYISSLFKIKNDFNKILEKSLELGRSFIIKEYQRHPLALFLLWKGILWYLLKNPDYKYLMGPVSISNAYSKQSKSLIVQFINGNYLDSKLSTYIKPRKKFMVSKKILKNNKMILEGIENNIKTLDLYINEFQPSLSIPVLLKKYIQMNGKIIGFNIDPDFNNCLDCLMLVHTSDIPFEMLDNLSKELKGIPLKERFKN